MTPVPVQKLKFNRRNMFNTNSTKKWLRRQVSVYIYMYVYVFEDNHLQYKGVVVIW